MQTLGVIADTHVPDRVLRLDPQALEIFKQARVFSILHAGDVCSPDVLTQLGRIAPVHAVQGNRDVWRLSHLPLKLTLEYEGTTIGLTHGHGGLFGYFAQKFSYFFNGYQLVYFRDRMRRLFPSARVAVFGHTHRSENTWAGDVLLFNPGPASKFRWGKITPSVGLLHIKDGGEIRGEIVPLDP